MEAKSSVTNVRQAIPMGAAAVLAGVAALALSMVLGAGQALAVDWPAPHIEDLGGKTYTVSYKPGKLWGGSITYTSAKSPKKKITKATSSNEEVATVRAYNGHGYHSLTVNINKAGTTDISYVFGGKKHTVKYVVKNYVNPLKSLKIGKKNYTKTFNLKKLANDSAWDAHGSVVTSGFTGKLNVKLKAGWKLKKVYVLNKSMKVGGKIKTSKNGAKLSKACCVWLVVKNSKTKVSETLYLSADSKAIHKTLTSALF